MQLVNTSAAETKEVQTVTATAPAGGTLAGTFALALDTRPTGGSLQYTGAIPASAAACCGRTSMTAMVEALYNVGAGGGTGSIRARSVAVIPEQAAAKYK